MSADEAVTWMCRVLGLLAGWRAGDWFKARRDAASASPQTPPHTEGE